MEIAAALVKIRRAYEDDPDPNFERQFWLARAESLLTEARRLLLEMMSLKE